MFGQGTLKPVIQVTDSLVECPVLNCKNTVTRQRNFFRCEQGFLCEDHGIYISPTTFEYQNWKRNLLWKDSSDIALLERIGAVKRESRMARDNSEDALTWNIFRYLEKGGLIEECLGTLMQSAVHGSEIIYWSYADSEQGLWEPLKKAREEFELVPSKGSEPDLIVISKNALIIIEAKLNAGNNTKPSNDAVFDKYTSGGNRLWSKVFRSSFQAVCTDAQKYELARFWLLGSWMAAQIGVPFALVNLVPDKREKNIEHNFKSHIVETADRCFKRLTWEDIYRFIDAKNLGDRNSRAILEYFESKTIGYSSKGELRRDFTTRL